MKILKKLLVGALMISASASAFAVSITYDYVGELLQAFDNSGNATNAIPGAKRVTASVTFTGSIADAILRSTGNFSVTERYTTGGLGNLTTLNPEVSWSISDGVNTLTKNSASNFLFDIGFVDGVLTTGVLSANYQATANVATPGDFGMFATSFSSNVTGSYYTTNQATGTAGGLPTYKKQEMNDFTVGTLTRRVDNVSAVPVPAALPLMASVLGLFGITRRRIALA